MNLLTTFDLLILMLYFGIIIWIGMHFARSQKSSEGYFATKKKIPGWIVALSMFAATLSCFTFIGFPGWTYRHDLQIILREYMAIIAVIICTLFAIRIYRSVVKISVFEYLEARFGYFARFYSSFGMIIGAPIGIGLLLYILCLALHGLTGISMILLISVIGVLTLIYTMWGGIEGCIYTEAIHGAMFIGSGLITLLYLLFFSSPQGPAEILEVAHQGGRLRIIDPTFNLHEPTLYMFIWVGFFSFLGSFGGSPHMVQRYLIAPSHKEANLTTWLSLLCCLITWAVFMSIGVLLWAFYQMHPDRLALPDMEPDAIFPYFMGHELPTGIAGLILAGLLASGLSGISSGLNSISACVQSDFYDRLVKNKDPRHRLVVSKTIVLVLGTLATFVALLLTLWEGGVMKFAADIIASIISPLLAGGLLAIFILGLGTRRTSRRGMNAGIIAGILFSLWAITTNPASPLGAITAPYLSFLPAYNIHMWWLAGLSSLFVVIFSYLLSLMIDPGWLAPKELTIYGHAIWGGGKDAAAPGSPAPGEVSLPATSGQQTRVDQNNGSGS